MIQHQVRLQARVDASSSSWEWRRLGAAPTHIGDCDRTWDAFVADTRDAGLRPMGKGGILQWHESPVLGPRCWGSARRLHLRADAGRPDDVPCLPVTMPLRGTDPLLTRPPLPIRSERAKAAKRVTSGSPVTIDEIDRRILRALRDDGRLTIVELADKAGLSTTPCWTRVKKLEASGVIQRYVALLDQRKLGLPDTVLIEITLDRHDEETLNRFSHFITAYPEILEAYLTSGGYDYIIKVAVEGTEGYERFLREKLYRVPGIRNSRSSFALRCLKQFHSVQP